MTQPLVLVSVQSVETLCCCSPVPCISFSRGVWGIDIVQNTKLPKGQGCVLCSEPRYNEMYWGACYKQACTLRHCQELWDGQRRSAQGSRVSNQPKNFIRNRHCCSASRKTDQELVSAVSKVNTFQVEYSFFFFFSFLSLGQAAVRIMPQDGIMDVPRKGCRGPASVSPTAKAMLCLEVGYCPNTRLSRWKDK